MLSALRTLFGRPSGSRALASKSSSARRRGARPGVDPALNGRIRTGEPFAPQARTPPPRNQGLQVQAKADPNRGQTPSQRAILQRTHQSHLRLSPEAISVIDAQITPIIETLKRGLQAPVSTARHEDSNAGTNARRNLDSLGARTLVQHVRWSPVTINFDPSQATARGETLVDVLLRDGHVRSPFEGQQTSETDTIALLRKEKIFYGEYGVIGQRPSDPRERPRYAALNIARGPAGATPELGDCYFELDGKIAALSTIVNSGCGDHLPGGPAPLTRPEHILSLASTRELQGLIETVVGHPWPLHDSRPFRVDVHIHGPVRLGREVRGIVVPRSQEGTEAGLKLRTLAKRHGMSFRFAT